LAPVPDDGSTGPSTHTPTEPVLTGPPAIVGLKRSLHRCAPVGSPAVEGRRGTGKRPFRSRCASVQHGARPNHERRGPPASHQLHPTGRQMAL